MRQYKNFYEIDRDLKLLKLRQEIDKEKVLLSYYKSKESLSPASIIKGMAGSIFKSAIVLKGTTKILGMVSKKMK